MYTPNNLDISSVNPEHCRMLVRNGEWQDITSGMAPGYLQGNVVILPKCYAPDFMQYCLNNPKPCPLIGVSIPGSRSIPSLGKNIDIALDIPKYRLYWHAHLIDEVPEILDYWLDDLVTFVLGCSFSFEHALQVAGHSIRHIDQQQNVPMFDTNIATMPGGIFNGQLVVTMRPVKRESLNEVYRICSEYPFAHGTPIHAGDPSAIGITNLNKPHNGEAVEVRDNEIPVFWACGVTTQIALKNGKPNFFITHAPGHMLITDIESVSGADSVSVSVDFYKSQ